MARRVLDTNILISFWLKRASKSRLRDISTAMARRWARELMDLHGAPALVTPVVIEFLCGAQNDHELRLWRAFLGDFEVADGGDITASDWYAARQYAERVPRDGLRRQMGDCLIRAICNRLHFEVITGEKRFVR